MTKVQFIKVTGGEDLAILPRRDYEQLAALAAGEDAGDARIARRARSALAAGREILLPKLLVDRLAAGKSPVRVLREWRDLTQVDLAAAVEITQGYLSDLEAGKRKGPLALHQKIATALAVPIDLLLPIASSEAKVSRSAKRQRQERGKGARRRK